MRPRIGLVSSVLVVAALHTSAAAAGPAAEPDPLATLRASLDRSLSSLPAAALAAPRTLRRHGGAGQARAEALFAGSLAAAWFADTGVVLALPLEAPAAPEATSLAASGQDAESLGTVTLAGFLAAVWRELPGGPSATPRVLVKLPRVAFRPDGGGLAAASSAEAAAHAAVVLQEGFETDPFAVWRRQDNTGGQYTWGQTTCDRHQGSYAADAARGGTIGSAAACSAAYPSTYEAWLWDPRCNSVRGAAQAWLDFYLGFSIQTGGGDSVNVCFPGSDNRYYCHGYGGTISGWWHVTDNLEQWFLLGDMTAFDCLEVNFLFDSDATPATTFGARIDDVTVRTDAPPTVSCGVTATPATGPAPLAVSFAGVATGASGAATYRWWFDDAGAQATTQNASHTFSLPGDYDVSLVVSDGSERCNAWTRVTVTQQACVVDCSASVPATAQAGAAVAFAGTVTPVGCPASTPAWEWTFGDGQTSSEQSPSHTYAAAGTYPWTLRVAVAGTQCTRSGAITVSAPPSSTRQLVPSVAQQPGAGGTQWRTSVAAVNRAAGDATLDLTFVSDTTTLSRVVTLPAGAAYEWGNVLAELFQVSGVASGALRIDSSVPVLVTSRTYNQTAAGTFGQYYPALMEAHALRAGQTGVLPQLRKTSEFRTNIGAANLGNAAASVAVRLHGASGQQVGSTRTIAVEAGRWKQESDIFTTSGAGTQEVAYATVTVLGAGDLVWVYASVIDARTGDPTTIPVVVDASRGTAIGPAAAPAVAAAPWPAGGGVVEPLAFGGTGLGIAAATPEDGYYSGTTSPQGLPMGLLVESGGIKQISIKYDCGGWTSDATYSYGSPCAVSGGGTFDCGSTSCSPGGTVRITGTFATPTSVSGVIEIKDKPAWPPGATCCQISGLAYSASKGGTPPPTVTASATPTSGQAPLQVAFTGSVTGGTAPLALAWSFGDGQNSTLQNPSHTYTSQGTYVAWFTVTDAQSRRGSDTVQITVSGGAALQASAAANPASGSAPLTVAFTGSASGGAPPYTWGWAFGDGGTSAMQDPIHTYAAAGTFTATLTVTDAAQRTATATAAITASGAAAYRYLIPSVAHNPGAGGTMWRTAVAAVNRSGAAATLQLRYVAGDGLTLSRTVTLAADAAQEWVNILETLLGLAATTSSSGTLEVTADRPVFLTSRTFNQTPGGTYGQYFPSLTAAAAMGPGRTGVLPHLKKNAAFRTNVGVLNLGQAACTAEIRLFGATGAQVGSTKQLQVPAGRWVQQSDIFASVGAGTHNVAYATVTVPGSGDMVWAYASVLDGTTGDPTTIPLLLATP